VTSDSIEVQNYIIENYFFWKSKEKTLFTLNICLLSTLAFVPLWFVPIRYFIVLGLWSAAASNSPFLIAIVKSLAQLALEQGVLIERYLPVYMDGLHRRISYRYIPWLVRVWRWVPIINRQIPGLFMELYYERFGSKKQDEKSPEKPQTIK
jgi:hypothetical protein